MYQIKPKPASDKEGLLNALMNAANHAEDGDAEEAYFILSDLIDTISAERVSFSYGHIPRDPREDVAAFAAANPTQVD